MKIGGGQRPDHLETHVMTEVRDTALRTLANRVLDPFIQNEQFKKKKIYFIFPGPARPRPPPPPPPRYM